MAKLAGRHIGSGDWACVFKTFARTAAYAATVLVMAASVFAQDQGDQPGTPAEPAKTESTVAVPEDGLQTARKLCATCHLIGEPPNSATAADVPGFASIANRPKQSAEQLTNWLIEPHQPMPNLHLTRKEIRDLAAYILTLRTAP